MQHKQDCPKYFPENVSAIFPIPWAEVQPWIWTRYFLTLSLHSQLLYSKQLFFLDVARLSPSLIVGKKTIVFSPVTKNIQTKMNNVYLKHTVVA